MTLFEYFESSSVREGGEAYDFNDNGRLDYDGIVELFRSIGNRAA